ncbi:MAG: 2-C-methyl-D-erythritol 4-phosphate cytidylyltransferase [Gemmatimonadales bacterium]|nr:2-C-methyl-D-erythritol 4-phosphate cytidylyltransferase [Gemmatimonadales bacterium]NIN50142.1 2-C-methyl-D-erythritol 4-phosphate cytidylyltransferase [Gemmatimonadales bacterium]NIP07606.1 2-C-methyl-D-erythritol 4-phosphate cytidylyltransferase [Gemmatimonadales bacterium]NIR01758.1 2-C-methyl-D-erythritol 4-phosphate cytidylyltransferase [Gemmatimonadales bacterium]NIS65661.1 2-C-methyl-D-erythritol 4-phosphate cytidylyltransferase [Gemmatimonadales bacterium]
MSPTSPVDSLPDVGVLIAAAGSGDRAGGGEPKQFRTIAGVPMLLRAVRPFAMHPRVRRIVVALPPRFAAEPPPWLATVAGERLLVVEGGATRAASVRAALAALEQGCRIVLVHDAARPFVSLETVDAVIATAAGGVAAVPAVPVSDTLKRADPSTSRIVETVDRTGLWHAQTPQGFPRDMLEEAYRHVEGGDLGSFTDEAAVVEAAGHPVEIVPDQTSNVKLTTAADFALAEAMIGP